MLFRSDAQRNVVCGELCSWNRRQHLWSAWPALGPSERAWGVLRGERISVDECESALARIAVALWEGRGELRFNHLLADLDVETRESIDTLLEALLGPPDALDAWIEEHGPDGGELNDEPMFRSPLLRKAG